MQPEIKDQQEGADTRFSERQAAVLECALGLLVDGGEKALTTAGLARTANCSKESLYKWFGDRDGLLAAVITYQAGKVGFDDEGLEGCDEVLYRKHLTGFVKELLSVLFGETSLALNRLAIGQSHRDDARLGRLLLERGKRMISSRARSLLEAGRAQGYLSFESSEDAYQLLYGLAVGEEHVRLLLGDEPSARDLDISGRAVEAVDRFFRLTGVETSVPGGADI